MNTLKGADRPAVSLLHRDPPSRPVKFFFHRRAVFAVSLGTALVLAALAAWNGGSVLLNIDEPVTEWVVRNRTPLLDDVFNWSSHLGDNVVVFACAAVLAALTWRRCRFLAVALIAAALFRPIMEFVLKSGIHRARPDIDPVMTFNGPSHPSGHPMAAASLWGLVPAVVALNFRGRGPWVISVVVSVAVVVMVAASRVYRGAHWFTDVVASLAWAAVYLAAVQGTMDRFHRGRDCVHPQHETQGA